MKKRFTGNEPGYEEYWTKSGRFDRTVITVDPKKTPTTEVSDLHVQLKLNSDYELISALLTLLHGKLFIRR
jgi:formylmethanofuran dehydrogenase subunit B